MNKPVYLGLSVLGLSKILIYEFWYNYVKPKYGEKSKLCYMIRKVSLYIQKQRIYIQTLQMRMDEARFHTSNYELDKTLPKGKNKKVIGLMQDELGGKIMTKFVGLKGKTYSYLIDDKAKVKKQKSKKCAIKRKRKETKISHPEKIKLTRVVLTNNKEFIRNNKTILKTTKI